MGEFDFESLEREHEALRFREFSHTDALAVGLKLIEYGRERGLSFAMDIRLFNQQVFHYALPGTTADNDGWLARKSRVAAHFQRSSLFVKELVKKEGMSLEEMFFLPPAEFSAFGGAFPILLENGMCIGTIAVSGLPDTEDHRAVVTVVGEYIKG